MDLEMIEHEIVELSSIVFWYLTRATSTQRRDILNSCSSLCRVQEKARYKVDQELCIIFIFIEKNKVTFVFEIW